MATERASLGSFLLMSPVARTAPGGQLAARSTLACAAAEQLLEEQVAGPAGADRPGPRLRPRLGPIPAAAPPDWRQRGPAGPMEETPCLVDRCRRMRRLMWGLQSDHVHRAVSFVAANRGIPRWACLISERTGSRPLSDTTAETRQAGTSFGSQTGRQTDQEPTCQDLSTVGTSRTVVVDTQSDG